MRRVLVIACVIALVSAGKGAAQSRLPVNAGDRVRVSVPAFSGTYVVDAVEDDGLLLRSDREAAPVRVPAASIERLDVSRGRRSAGHGALRGAGIGLLAGAGVGAIIGYADGDDEPSGMCFFCYSAEEKAVIGMVLVGGSASLLGGIIGMAAPGERWQRVQLPARVAVLPVSSGRLALAVSTRF